MASTVTIEELSGLKRVLQLRGGAMPNSGAPFPAALRVTTTWLPGNGTEATQQVLGASDGAPEWEGYWSTPVLASLPSSYSEGGGDPRPVATAKTLWDIVDAIRAAGSKLRMTWTQDDDLTVVREGRITEFEVRPRTKHDITWTMSWEWTGRGGASSRVVSLKKDQQLAKHKQIENELNKLAAELSASTLFSSNRDIYASASSFSLGDLESFVDSFSTLTQGFARQVTLFGSRIRQLGELIESVESLPADIAQQFVDAAASIMSDCAAFNDAVTRRGPEAYTLFDQSASVKAIAHAAAYLSAAKAASDRVILACAGARSALLKKSGIEPGSPAAAGKPTPTAVSFVIAKQGDTFASIAKKKLGDPNLGPAVAKATGYAWFDPAPLVGEVVVIPSQQAAQQLLPGA